MAAVAVVVVVAEVAAEADNSSRQPLDRLMEQTASSPFISSYRHAGRTPELSRLALEVG